MNYEENSVHKKNDYLYISAMQSSNKNLWCSLWYCCLKLCLNSCFVIDRTSFRTFADYFFWYECCFYLIQKFPVPILHNLLKFSVPTIFELQNIKEKLWLFGTLVLLFR